MEGNIPKGVIRMGYWSVHPMGGDAPSDYRYKIVDALFAEEEQEYDLHWNKEVYKIRLEAHLAEVADLVYMQNAIHFDFTDVSRTKEGFDFENVLQTPYVENCSFVVPYEVIAYQIRISDKQLSAKIKEMIGDGGAANRQYQIPKESDHDFPTRENKWNGLQTPFDHARMLHDLWDDIMLGNLSFDAVKEDSGLFAALAQQDEDGQSGLINKQ